MDEKKFIKVNGGLMKKKLPKRFCVFVFQKKKIVNSTPSMLAAAETARCSSDETFVLSFARGRKAAEKSARSFLAEKPDEVIWFAGERLTQDFRKNVLPNFILTLREENLAVDFHYGSLL